MKKRDVQGGFARRSAMRAWMPAAIAGWLLTMQGRAHGQPAPEPAPPIRPSDAALIRQSVPTTAPTTVRAPAPVVPATVPASQVPRSGHVRLAFQRGAAMCDSEALFRKIFASELGAPDPFEVTGEVEHVIEVRLDPDPPGFRSLVEVRDASGAVLFHTVGIERTCVDASDRVMVALLVNVFGPPPSPPPPSPPPVPPPASTGSRDDFAKHRRDVEARLDAQDEKIEELEDRVKALQKALDEEKRKMDLTFVLSAGALMTANLTSNVGPGVWIEGDARTGPLSLGLQARVVLPAPVFLGPYSADVSQVMAVLTPCGRYSYFFGCAVAGAGVEIHHLADPRLVGLSGGRDSGPVLHIGGRVGGEVFFGDSPFGARAWVDVLYSAPKTGIDISRSDGTKLSWDRPDVSAFFGLGLVFRFGKEAK